MLLRNVRTESVPIGREVSAKQRISVRSIRLGGTRPQFQIGTFVPPAPAGAPTGTIQLNDVFVDEREVVYTVDRHIGGLYCLEMDF